MISHFLTSRPMLLVIWALVFLVLMQPCASALAQVQGDCSAKLKEAEKKFDNGDFDASITLIEGCLKEGTLTQQEKARGYELLAQNYTSKSYLEQANSAIRKLLELVPNYNPNPDQFSPTFVEEVKKVKQEMASEKPQKEEQKGGGIDKKWFIIGGGVVAAGVIIALVAGKKSEEAAPPLGALPGPPVLP